MAFAFAFHLDISAPSATLCGCSSVSAASAKARPAAVSLVLTTQETIGRDGLAPGHGWATAALADDGRCGSHPDQEGNIRICFSDAERICGFVVVVASAAPSSCFVATEPVRDPARFCCKLLNASRWN